MLLASFIVAIRCSGSRERRAREAHLGAVVAVAPGNAQLIRGKLWGIINAARPYLLAYALPAVVFAVLGGPLALFWTFSLAGDHLAGDVLCRCRRHLVLAARSKSSWRSLVGTLGLCYVGGFVHLRAGRCWSSLILAYFLLTVR